MSVDGTHENVSLIVSAALAAGVLSLVVARHLRLPNVIVLLIVGVILGPEVLSWIETSRLGASLHTIVGIAVAIILFEGGLHLNLKRIGREGAAIRRLITLGALITCVFGAFTAMLWLKWDWKLSLLFGSLIIVTGPTVVTPLLRKIQVQKNLQTVLEAEGVLIDPIGAIFAIAALDFVVSSEDQRFLSGLILFSSKMGLGFLLGLLGGFIIGFLLRRERLVPDELENIFTLGLVLFLFEISNAIYQESGIMTVTIAGMVVGNMKLPRHRQLVDFKEQLTSLLIGVLFVLLSADIKFLEIEKLGWPAIGAVISVMFIVRPLNVFICLRGLKYNWREFVFLSWLAPRGIVSAAVAALFASSLASMEIPGGEQLQGLVFLIISSTVLFQGLTAGPLAQILGLKQKVKYGYLIIGSNSLARILGKILSTQEDDIVFIDRNFEDCGKAEREGFNVVYGNALEESTLLRGRPELKKGVISITPNEGANILVTRRIRENFREVKTFSMINLGSDVERDNLQQDRTSLLFGGQIDYSLWVHRVNHKIMFLREYQREEMEKGSPIPSTLDFIDLNEVLPMAVIRKKDKIPYYSGRQIEKDEKILVMGRADDLTRIHQKFSDNGYTLYRHDEVGENGNTEKK